MVKTIYLVILTFLSIQGNAQTIEEKIEQLIERDGTISTIEKQITQTIEFQKRNNLVIHDNYWRALKNKISKKSIDEFKLIAIPIYSQNYTESEIDSLITFFNSKTGKLITQKQPLLLEQMSLGLMQWTENLNSYIIEEIENKGKNDTSTDEIEKFATEFKTKYGLQILNMNDLAIDQENNIGDLLVDFGKTDGKEDLTKVIRIKNNSNEEITFEKPTLLNSPALKFDWGNAPVKIGETRDLKITLIAEQAENRSYSSFPINSSNGNKIQIGIKYDAPTKEISFEISENKLKLKKLKNDVSKPYVFVLKNTGKKDFHIYDIKIDKAIAYINYSKEVLKPNQKTEIRIIISKELIEKYTINDPRLNLKVDLKKGSKDNFSNYPNETIELSIE
jgi:hypothetical protein